MHGWRFKKARVERAPAVLWLLLTDASLSHSHSPAGSSRLISGPLFPGYRYTSWTTVTAFGLKQVRRGRSDGLIKECGGRQFAIAWRMNVVLIAPQ